MATGINMVLFTTRLQVISHSLQSTLSHPRLWFGYNSTVKSSINDLLRLMGNFRIKRSAPILVLDAWRISRFLKELKKVWAKKYPSGSFSPVDTLMIDNDPYKGLLNPPNTAIYPEKFKLENKDDKLLGPKGELQEFLNGVADAKDVTKYVKEHARFT